VLDILAIITLLVIAVTFSLVPLVLEYFFRSDQKRDYFLSLGNVFAGGLFFSAAFIHLLGEGNEVFQDDLGGNYAEYPYAYLIAPLGFSLVFFVEKVWMKNSSSSVPYRSDTTEFTSEEESIRMTPQTKSYSHHDNGTDHKHTHGVDIKNSSFLPLLIVVILSFHEFIAGLAFGLQDDFDTALPIFVALCAHKWIEAIAVGVAILRAGLSSRWTYIKIIIAYSITAPLGIAFGMLLHLLNGEVLDLLTGSCTALASGTFMYVAVVDILIPEFDKPDTKKNFYIKFVCAGIGFTVLALLQLGFKHDHNDHHDDSESHSHI